MSTTYPSEEVLTAKRLEGVIEPNKLAPNTLILVETTAQVFEFLTREDGKIWATGAGKRGFGRQSAEFVGSIDQNGTLFADMIVRNHHLIIKLVDGRYTTGCVKSASIQGNGYKYELWSDE